MMFCTAFETANVACRFTVIVPVIVFTPQLFRSSVVTV